MNIFLWLLVGAIAGFLAGNLTKGQGFGLIGNIVVGLIGSLFGGWLFSLFGVQDTNFIGSTLVATGGAVVLLYIVNFFTGRQ